MGLLDSILEFNSAISNIDRLVRANLPEHYSSAIISMKNYVKDLGGRLLETGILAYHLFDISKTKDLFRRLILK